MEKSQRRGRSRIQLPARSSVEAIAQVEAVVSVGSEGKKWCFDSGGSRLPRLQLSDRSGGFPATPRAGYPNGRIGHRSLAVEFAKILRIPERGAAIGS